jgi:hypothetical protein
MDAFSDGLGFQPRIGEPESSVGLTARPAGGPPSLLAANMPDTSIGPVALQEPARWVYDFDPGSGMSRATFSGLVQFTEGGSETAGVTSWNGETGAVVMTNADIVAAGGLANPSPTLTGVPNAPTAAPGTNSTQLATCQFVTAAVNAGAGVSTFNGRAGAVVLTAGDITGAGGAPSVSPALTGVPTAPTAAQGDTSSQIATDAFVANAIAGGTVISFNGRRGAVALTLSDVQSVGGAPIASPTFTGVPAVPTAAPGSATTQAASTAFVTNAISGGTAGVASFNTRTGAVVLTPADIASAGGAPLLSPALTGTPTAPTPTAGDATTKIATTAYVETAIGSLPAGVSTFNGRTGTVTLALADVTSVGGAPLASPTFTGSPLSTTPAPLDNSTRIATTAFVDAALPAPSTTTPLMNGTAAIGVSALFARADHVHPVDTSRYAASNPSGFQTAAQVTATMNAGLADYLPLAGGTITGGLTVAGGATINSGIITLQGPSANFVMLQLIADATPVGQFYCTATAGNIFLTNEISASNLQLDASANFTFTGSGVAFKAGGGAWAATSDARTKDELGEFEPGLEQVIALRPIVYAYKGNDSASPDAPSPHLQVANERKAFFGLIAQEAETVFPEMVTHRAGYVDGEPVNDLRSVDTTPLIFALVNAVKELSARLAALEAR